MSPRAKANPYRQGLLNGINVWGVEQFVEALSAVDREQKNDFSVSRGIMEKLMVMAPMPAKRELSLADVYSGSRDAPIRVDQISDVLGLCKVCGKLRAEVLVSNDESGAAVPVCGDCYGKPEMVVKGARNEEKEPEEEQITEPNED